MKNLNFQKRTKAQIEYDDINTYNTNKYHESNYFDIHGYQKPFTYNTSNNFIKSYNVSDKVINNLKNCYPDNNSYPIFPEISKAANLFILKVYLTNTITIIYLFNSAKEMNKKIDNIGSRALRYYMRKIFVIPEMNVTFTQKQIMKAI
jgi:hypothetical protein